MSEWISVDKGFPKHEQQVWVSFQFTDGYSAQGYAIWDDEDGWFLDVEGTQLLARKHAEEMGLDFANVSHWMSIPEPPK